MGFTSKVGIKVSPDLFKSDGRMEPEVDRWTGASSSVMRALHWFFVAGERAEMNGEAFSLL